MDWIDYFAIEEHKRIAYFCKILQTQKTGKIDFSIWLSFHYSSLLKSKYNLGHHIGLQLTHQIEPRGNFNMGSSSKGESIRTCLNRNRKIKES